MKRTYLGVFEMANKPTQPVFPLGLAAEKQSTLAGVLNTGTIEHGPDAVLTLPEGNASAGLPSSVRYNADSDKFEGFYENGGWLPLGGGGIRWEVLPHASTATLTEGRGYLINNTTGASTVVLPPPTRVGDSVTICDAYGKFATYPLTVSPSGNNLYGSTEDMAITTDNVSATFTWSGPEQGWIITSGVGLGQGRVYSREIFTKILASETSSVALNTPPTIVDVYADGKRLTEFKYSLDGNVITFSPSLPASTELQVIEYTPIQLGDVGGSGSSTITWVYNGGSAIGGETEITLDVVVDDVPAIDINGSRQYKNLGFTFDPLTSKITLAQELEPEDEVVVIINGTPNIYNQIDYTLREVARATNVKDTEVVYFSVGAALSGYKVIYDKETQRAYPLPADIAPGTTAVSLSSSAVLVHSAGSVDLGELAVSREEYVTLSGTFDTGVTVNTKNELVVFTDGKYRWDGSLPKVVPAESTPDSTGGVKLGAWIGVGEASFKTTLASNSGAGHIGVATSEGNLGELLSADDMAIKYGYINESVSERLAKYEAKVVLVGDSLSTPFVTSSVNTTASFESFLRRKVAEFNSTAKFYNRAIGGARYYELGKDSSNMPEQNSNYPWYTDISQRWINYIADVKPDVIFIAFGMNDGNGWSSGAFPQATFFSLMDELRSISSNPEVVFCTNLLPSTINPITASEEMQRGRDAMAGWTRSFAGRAGYSLMDFHRRFKCLRDGVDPCIASYARKTLERTVTLPYAHPTDCESYSATITINDPNTATTGIIFNLSAYTNNILSLRYDASKGLWRTTVYTGVRSSIGESDIELTPGTAPEVGTKIYFSMNGDVVTISIGVNTNPVFSKRVVRFGGKFSPQISGSGSILLSFMEGTLVPVKSELTDYDIYSTGEDGGNGINHPTAKATSRIFGRVVDDWFNLLTNTVPKCKHVVDINFARGTLIVNNPYCPDLTAETKIGAALTFINGSLSYSRDSDNKVIGAIFGATNRAYIDQSLFNNIVGYKKLGLEVEFVAPNAQAFIMSLGERLLTENNVTVQVSNSMVPRVTTLVNGDTSDLFSSSEFPCIKGRVYKLIYTIDCVSGVVKSSSPDNMMRGNIATTSITDLPSTLLSKLKLGYHSTTGYGADVVIRSIRLSFSN